MSEILFLAHRVPFPPNRGDKIRSAHLLKKLADLGPVHVGCFSETDEDRAGAAEVAQLAQSYCVVNRGKPLVLAGAEAVLAGKPVSLTAFQSASLANWVRHTVRERPISTIVIFSGQMGQYVPDDFAGRLVIDLCDVDSAKFENYAADGQRVWLNAREARLLAREEERLARRADTTILISENEAELFRSRLQFPSMANIAVMGNGINATSFDPAIVTANLEITGRPGPHFVFTGQMDYPPNEQAAIWAAQKLFRCFRVGQPSAELHIVGRNPTGQVRGLAELEGVTVWGEVPDIKPFIAAADCVIAPLLIARGVQNKVLEAMAMARPVMVTPQAATGIDASDGEHWMVCEADEEAMAGRIDALLGDPTACEAMGAAARSFVLNHHDWDAMLVPLEQWVNASAGGARNAA